MYLFVCFFPLPLKQYQMPVILGARCYDKTITSFFNLYQSKHSHTQPKIKRAKREINPTLQLTREKCSKNFLFSSKISGSGANGSPSLAKLLKLKPLQLQIEIEIRFPHIILSILKYQYPGVRVSFSLCVTYSLWSP
jgi:hypothetical protein